MNGENKNDYQTISGGRDKMGVGYVIYPLIHKIDN